MKSKEIKKLLETKRYSELTEDELKAIGEYLGKMDGSGNEIKISIQYDELLSKIRGSGPVLDNPEELTAIIMEATEETKTQVITISFFDRIIDAIAAPNLQFAAKALLVFLFCFYFFEEISFSNEVSNFEEKYYSETVAAAGMESILKSEASLLKQLENIYKLVISEKDYLEIGDEWLVMRKSEQKRIMAYYINYVLGNNYDEQELKGLVDRLESINFLDGLDKNELKELDKHRKLIQNEITNRSSGGTENE